MSDLYSVFQPLSVISEGLVTEGVFFIHDGFKILGRIGRVTYSIAFVHLMYADDGAREVGSIMCVELRSGCGAVVTVWWLMHVHVNCFAFSAEAHRYIVCGRVCVM